MSGLALCRLEKQKVRSRELPLVSANNNNKKNKTVTATACEHTALYRKGTEKKRRIRTHTEGHYDSLARVQMVKGYRER